MGLYPVKKQVLCEENEGTFKNNYGMTGFKIFVGTISIGKNDRNVKHLGEMLHGLSIPTFCIQYDIKSTVMPAKAEKKSKKT